MLPGKCERFAIRIWESGTKRDRDRKHLEFRGSQSKQSGTSDEMKKRRSERRICSQPNYVVHSGICVNCGGMSIDSTLDGKVSIPLTDHRNPHRWSRSFYDLSLNVNDRIHCVGYRSQKAKCPISNRCRTSGEDTEESAISSRTSNHRLLRLVELFGICDYVHPRLCSSQKEKVL